MFSLALEVEKSVVIKKPCDDIFQFVSNFENWAHWSPWLCQEKDCPVEVTGDKHTVGHKQHWKGQRIGEGSIQISNMEIGKSLFFDLEFFSPWKSQAKVSFHFSQQGSATKVRWTMKGSLPIYLFFLKSMMAAMVGNDYERGLSMLKEYLETGKVLSLTKLTGKVDKQGFHYLGVKRSSSIEELPKIMEEDFGKIRSLMDQGKLPKSSQMLSFYHKFDFMRNKAEYTNALVCDENTEGYAEFRPGSVPDHKAAQVVHIGSYQNIGNAWSTVMGYQRHAKLKANKKVPWYEWYINSPKEVETKDLKTEVNVPVA